MTAGTHQTVSHPPQMSFIIKNKTQKQEDAGKTQVLWLEHMSEEVPWGNLNTAALKSGT